MCLDAGYDLFYLASDLYLGAEKFSGLLYFLAGDDLAHLELHRPELIKCDLFFWFNIDHSFFFPAFGLFSFFHMRMKFLYFFHYFFEVQSLEEDLRLVSHMAAAQLLQDLSAC